MKIIALIIVAFFNMNSCSSEKISQEAKQYIEKVTYQNWVGGVKGAGGGTNLNITLLKALPSNMELIKIMFINFLNINGLFTINYYINGSLYSISSTWSWSKDSNTWPF